MLGYTRAYDSQGINQWIYGRIMDPALHPDPAVSGGDWINILFRDLELNEDNTLTWLNVTGVESFMIYAFDSADETDPDNAVASATLQREHDMYLPPQRNIEVSFDLSELTPALSDDGTYFFRIQAMAQEVPVRGQEPLLWGVHSPLSEPVSAVAAEVPAEAEVEAVKRHFRMTLGSSEIVDLADGVTRNMGVVPVIREGRTLVPARYVAESLGGTAEWNAAASEVTMTVDGVVLTFAIEEMVESMDVPAQLIDGQPLVPLRFIAEYFGADVCFNDSTRVIEVVK